MSTFIDQIHQDFIAKLSAPSPAPSNDNHGPTTTCAQPTADAPNSVKDALRKLFVDLDVSALHDDWRPHLQSIRRLQQQDAFAPTPDPEQEALGAAIVAKVVVGLYLHVLTQYLEQARQADHELEWWAELERSRLQAAYYLLQSECQSSCFYNASLTSYVPRSPPSTRRQSF